MVSLRGRSSPASSRQGNFFGMIGMVIAIATTLASHPPSDAMSWILVVAGIAIGGSIGAVIARRGPLPPMPELGAPLPSLGCVAPVLGCPRCFYDPGAFDI